MGAFSGLGSHTTTGSVGVAILAGTDNTLAFQDFATDAAAALTGYLTVNGKLEKRKIELGTLPQTSGSFSIAFPAGTDISYFNTVVVMAGETAVGQAGIP